MDFRENLTRLRLERHMTQMDFAEAMGVSLDAVVQWENGEAEPPIKDLLAISDVLGVSVDYLLRKSEMDADPFYESETGTETEAADEATYCPCCGREVKGSLCLACEFPVTGYQEKGPKYAITSLSVNGADFYEMRSQLVKYCGITEEEMLGELYNSTERKVLKRGLSDVAVHWIASRIDPQLLSMRIVEDLGESEEELVKKPDIMEKPVYIYKKDESIGVGGIILIVVLTIIVLSFL